MNTCMNATMVEQVRRSTEAFAAEVAFVIALAGVHPPVDNQRILASKGFAAIFTLVLTDARVQRRVVVLQIAPLSKFAPAFIAFVRSGTCYSIEKSSIID